MDERSFAFTRRCGPGRGFDRARARAVADDTNAYHDAFVHDRTTGATSRVSIGTNGEQANDNSVIVRISGDGQIVAFRSEASSFPLNAPIGRTHISRIWARDRAAGTTMLVSIASAGFSEEFWDDRGVSLLQNLLPALACNEQSYIKPAPTSTKCATRIAPQQGLVQIGFGSTGPYVLPTFGAPSTTGTTCGSLGGTDDKLYAKAGGSGGSGQEGGRGVGSTLTGRLAVAVSRLPSDLPDLERSRGFASGSNSVGRVPASRHLLGWISAASRITGLVAVVPAVICG